MRTLLNEFIEFVEVWVLEHLFVTCAIAIVAVAIVFVVSVSIGVDIAGWVLDGMKG
jgi:hypothetical protein